MNGMTPLVFCCGNQSSLSMVCKVRANPNCFMLLRHLMRAALAWALARAGSSIAGKIAMMAITTKSSINAGMKRMAANA
jgi:hypothetical protein